MVIVVGPPAPEEASEDELDAALDEALAGCRPRAPPPRSPSG